MIQLSMPFWDFFHGMKKWMLDTERFDDGDYYMCAFLFIVFLILVGLVVWLIYALVYEYFDKRSSTTQILFGELIDKRYVAEQTSSQEGSAIIPNTSGGIGVGIISSTSTSEEEFLFFVKSDKVYKINVGMQEFYNKKISDKITFQITIGGLSKSELSNQLIS